MPIGTNSRAGDFSRRPHSFGVLIFLLVVGVLLPGCMELAPEIAPRSPVQSRGLGASRKDWEREHSLDGGFERQMGPVKLRGLSYDAGRYLVTYWVDGPQEVASSYARISRIEFDIDDWDSKETSDLVRTMLPHDADMYDSYRLTEINTVRILNGTEGFTDSFLCPSLADAYEHLEVTKHTPLQGQDWAWASVSYSLTSPNVVIQLDPWGGIPPESAPPPLGTLPLNVPAPITTITP